MGNALSEQKAAPCEQEVDADTTPPEREPPLAILRSKESQLAVRLAKEQQAEQARAEREERKRFAAQQKEMIRQRGAGNRAEQKSKTAERLDELARKKMESQGPRVVNLGTLSSVERAEIQRYMMSPALCGDRPPRPLGWVV